MRTKKLKNSVCIFSGHPIFNSDFVEKMENLSREDTTLLYSLLVSNSFENLNKSNVEANKGIYLNNIDIDFVPKEFISEDYNLILADSINSDDSLKKLSSDFFENHENNILLGVSTIGLSVKTFEMIFNLLSGEDDILIIGKSDKNQLAFLGFNSPNIKDFISLFNFLNNYEKLLKEVNKRDVFVHTLNGFQVISSFSDFKNLYYELSKKESLTYCSEQMHEKFTNLFIEYKDYLK